MTIRLLDGLPLIVGGHIAIHDDCCCSPSCLPNVCVSPSPTNCKYCWNATCEQCLEWQTLEIAISGVGEASVPLPWIPIGCRTGFDCQCDLFNSSFIHSIATNCESSWWVREASPPFALFDTCGTPQTPACNNWQIRRDVYVRVAVANEAVSYTTGTVASLAFPNMMTFTSGYANQYCICNSYTIQPGHYVLVMLSVQGRVGGPGGATVYSNQKYFLYSFANGVKVDVSCSDDQYYPGCGPYIGGDATLLASSRFSRATTASSPVYYADCDDFPELCMIGDATVTVEPPVVLDCIEEPPPPPPP